MQKLKAKVHVNAMVRSFEFSVFILVCFFFILPQNTSNTKKQGDHTKANKSGEEAQKETIGLIDFGLPQSKK